MSDQLLFGVFPYIAIVLAVVVSIVRYRFQKFKFSSLSSQFLETRNLFWGSVPWHYGILGVLTGHFVAFLCPDKILAFNEVPLRLVALEVTGLALALLAFTGLTLLIYRRLTHKRIQVVSRPSDYAVLFFLMIQVITGILIAILYRWGSSWYAASMVPYLRSLFILNPKLGYVASMPWPVKLHIVNAFIIVMLIPFTRFVHFLVIPVQYVARPWQIVRWNWSPDKTGKH
ncbi:MAG: respiratory nitrate reductase subunit gamma [Bacteriovoracaceae bacterium]